MEITIRSRFIAAAVIAASAPPPPPPPPLLLSLFFERFAASCVLTRISTFLSFCRKRVEYSKLYSQYTDTA
jgi:hypothetical protein